MRTFGYLAMRSFFPIYIFLADSIAKALSWIEMDTFNAEEEEEITGTERKKK